ncbi:transcriptional regulator, AraC family [Phenylobacterium zucineum HLK1]|uniref:Transcriptional regulator, AraC family n=1 Tax=Phenylobacterium zucineum (strain HLK1) TaxID=450851 RepID=B4R9V1_PHEZH|nr:transcriptional regulator, AraC family [Phenylobacterium zucineum HLK1]
MGDAAAAGLLAAAGEPHRVETSRGFDMVSVYCAGAWLRRLPSRPGVVPVSALLKALIGGIPDAGPARRRRLALLFADEVHLEPAPALFIPELAGRLLGVLAAALRADPADERTLAAWAAELGVSSRTLAREFERRAQLTFTAYRRQVRLRAALIRMAEGQSITQVGLDLGFGSASNFIRAFRAATGVTPARYFAARTG